MTGNEGCWAGVYTPRLRDHSRKKKTEILYLPSTEALSISMMRTWRRVGVVVLWINAVSGPMVTDPRSLHGIMIGLCCAAFRNFVEERSSGVVVVVLLLSRLFLSSI